MNVGPSAPQGTVIGVATHVGTGEILYCIRTGNEKDDTWAPLEEVHAIDPPPEVVLETVEHAPTSDRMQRRFLRDRHRPRNVTTLEYLGLSIPTWYYSPYHITGALPSPECGVVGSVWCCDGCLSPYASAFELQRHTRRCQQMCPPGQVVYRDSTQAVAVYRVKGQHNVQYCRFLVLLGKLFLQDKLMGHNVDTYDFYCLCLENGNNKIPRAVRDGEGLVVAMFSQDTMSTVHNLSCIATIPPFQGCGLGSFLIEFSYALSKRRGLLQGPEYPLSAQGMKVYHAYWDRCILRVAFERLQSGAPITMRDLAVETGLTIVCVVETLGRLGLVHRVEQRRDAIGGGPTEETVLVLQEGMVTWMKSLLRPLEFEVVESNFSKGFDLGTV